jgi:Lrp/AsnC family transcriptional regulator, regulator for asnA, asnC and gidA
VDDIDRTILQRLREDASSTNAAIGAAVGLTEAAVRRRIRRLRSDGTIVRYTVVTQPLGPEGVVLVRCRPGRTPEILKSLQAKASEVFETSGEFDLGAVIEQPTMERFNAELDRIRSLDGVVSTVTLVRLTRTVRPLEAFHRPEADSGPGGARRAPAMGPRDRARRT